MSSASLLRGGVRSIGLSPTGVSTALAKELSGRSLVGVRSISLSLTGLLTALGRQAATLQLRTHTELAGIRGTGNKGSL